MFLGLCELRKLSETPKHVEITSFTIKNIIRITLSQKIAILSF